MLKNILKCVVKTMHIWNLIQIKPINQLKIKLYSVKRFFALYLLAEILKFLFGIGEFGLANLASSISCCLEVSGPQSDRKWLFSSPGTGGRGELWSNVPSWVSCWWSLLLILKLASFQGRCFLCVRPLNDS